MNSFLICPVRGHSQLETKYIVDELESKGWKVHWPPRDTNQDDFIGYRICKENLEAIRRADCIHIIWDGQSQGCLFDLGMAFALNKKIKVINLPEISVGKSFQNMIREWEKV